MPIRSVSPYITLDGAAQQAIEHYQRSLGATTATVARAGDVPGSQAQGDRPDRIVHAELRLDGAQLFISDAGAASGSGAVQVSLDFTEVAEMTERFAALGEGGTVMVPIQKMFWGATFGMVTDRFGVSWMFTCAG